MSIPKDLLQNNPCISDWCILSGYRGSISHGTFVPSIDPNSIDDKDIMAICIPPIDYYFGSKNFGSKGTKEIKVNEWDIVVYEFRKMIGLLTIGNPNVLSLLWIDDIHYTKKTGYGQLLIDNRKLFIGKHVYKSFTGYAYGQLHRMTHMAFEGYMGEKRKGLVKKYGYDTKNASHLIRLLRMGIEFLTDGTLYVNRQDSHELLAIKRGEWSLEKVKKEAERLFALAGEAYIRSDLPKYPDYDGINKLSIQILLWFHESHYSSLINSYHD